MSIKPLRILAVIYLPWDRRLGASRVFMELADEWRAAGHVVDHYCLTDAFPKETKWRAMVALRQVSFAHRAAAYIRKNAGRYDVIDSLLGTVPVSKKSLCFRGLLVARSVGFYKLYENFDVHARRRWPDQPKGTFPGRIVYSYTKRRSLVGAEKAVRHADLINLPNEDEQAALREDSDKPAIIQPYGLTPKRAQALLEAAESVAARLAKKRISFIGMWSVRKGAKDWGEIVRRIRSQVPEATFRFLGTMTDDRRVLEDLGLTKCGFVELISEYEPDELPKLLSDCALGVFPSYVEGFGFGVLEQLAAGIPTVAYDVPGPRQILEPLRKLLLTPAGDVDAIVARAIQILQMESYGILRQESLSIAEKYSWPKIAEQTLGSYRRALSGTAQHPIIFTHPFGLQSTGGGPRIMRALLEDAPLPFVSVCTAPKFPPAARFAKELHVSLRPSFGRIEKTRFAGFPQAFTPLFAKRFTRKLERVCVASKARAIHAIAHGGLDFHHAFLLSRKLGLPFFFHLHDDFRYSARVSGALRESERALHDAWQGAAARFVIGPQLGDEYCRRYGAREYTIITDGIEEVAEVPVPRLEHGLRIYFMGLFHLEYEENLRSLLAALAALEKPQDAGELSVTLRCGGVRRAVLRGHETRVTILPFGSEADVQADLQKADLLYLPLPFSSATQSFVRFSLSTKLVTYLGSGVPILYHGPESSAVCDLLRQNDAALIAPALEGEPLTKTLQAAIHNQARRRQIVENALRLVRRQFMLAGIRERFWSTISAALAR